MSFNDNRWQPMTTDDKNMTIDDNVMKSPILHSFVIHLSCICHQLSLKVIDCHQMSSNVIECQQMSSKCHQLSDICHLEISRWVWKPVWQEFGVFGKLLWIFIFACFSRFVITLQVFAFVWSVWTNRDRDMIIYKNNIVKPIIVLLLYYFVYGQDTKLNHPMEIWEEITSASGALIICSLLYEWEDYFLIWDKYTNQNFLEFHHF